MSVNFALVEISVPSGQQDLPAALVTWIPPPFSLGRTACRGGWRPYRGCRIWAQDLGSLSDIIARILQGLPPNAFARFQTANADLSLFRCAVLADPQDAKARFLVTVLDSDDFARLLQASDPF